jgi:hypothetical protein
MRPAALSIAVLLGIAALGADARAASIVTTSVTIAAERSVLVGGKRHHRHGGFHRGGTFHGDKGFGRDWIRHGNKGFDRGWIRHGDKGFARHHHGFGRGRTFHKGLARHHHRFERVRPWPRHVDTVIVQRAGSDTVLVQRVGKSQFVLVTPTFGRSVRYHQVAPSPLIKNGRLARRFDRW